MTIGMAFIHFTAIALSTVCTALGVSLGQGKSTKAAFDAINRQPAAQGAIARTNLLSLALIETGAILGFLVSFLLFFNPPQNYAAAVAEIGMCIAISIPGLIVGLSCALPAYHSFKAIARQPFMGKKISNMMLLTQSLIQTPLIFGFIIALTIRTQLLSITHVSQALTLIGSSIAIGLGCVGPAIGGGIFTGTACKSTGLNKNAYAKLFTFTFISQAIIETPVIFAAIIALFLTTTALTVPDKTILGVAYMAFGAIIGFGTFGAGISSGRSAAAAAEQIGINPQSYSLVGRASLMAQGLIDTCAVYAFIIALWLILTPLI